MTQRPVIIKKEGLWLEWFARRSSLDVDIYVENPDHSRGQLITQLEYPKVSGIGYSDWTPEAISIARKELAKSKEAS
jgi:hypothetical protein